MKPPSFLLLLILFSQTSYGQTKLSGRVFDEADLPLNDANVFIRMSKQGTRTNSDGYFSIELGPGTYAVLISSLGYKTQTISFVLDREAKDLGEFHLISVPQLMDEVVISGSRLPEKITESPAAIDVVDEHQFENFTGSPEELFALQKGVDFARIGNFLGSISIRGFNSSFNQKMLLLDDNRIANVRIRTPVGPMSPFVKEDIERVELVLGPSSALYGPNCLNGLFNTISKSPFERPGTNVVFGTGSNKLLNLRMRHARKLGNKWAYKITFEYLSGVEEDFTDSVYLSPQGSAGPQEGKPEVGLDRDLLFLKGVAAVYYKPTGNSEIGINYSFNRNNSISVGSRNNLVNWYNAALQVTYKSPHWFAQFYKTWIKLGPSIDTRTRTINYNLLLAKKQPPEQAFHNSLNEPFATHFEEDTYRLNGEIQYNNHWGNCTVVAGIQGQREVAASNNTFYIGEPVRLNMIGVYGQLTYSIKKTGIKLIATARADDHSLFGFNFLPKAGLTYNKNKSTWRLTYGEGVSNPTLINTYLTFDAGTSLGNSDGFTLADGTKVAPIKPETLKTLEVGYKSIFYHRKLFLDVDAYYNWADNLISPSLEIAKPDVAVTLRGNRPIGDFTKTGGESIYTNINYGHANTYGVDIGLNYYFSDRYSATLNYSFFDYYVDRNDLSNDVNHDGVVNSSDIATNTPTNKISSAFNVMFSKFYGSLFGRWVQEYNFFSGRNLASSTRPGDTFKEQPIVEGQRVGPCWNYGPLGGFYLSINGNYQLTRVLNLGIFVNNILGQGNFEFVGSPPTETTMGVEIKLSL